jgi:hypothetical protein
MSSFVHPDKDKIDAPLNVTVPAPVLDLKDFHWQAVDEAAPPRFLDGHIDGHVNGQRPFTNGLKALEHLAATAFHSDTTPSSQKPRKTFGDPTPINSGVKPPLDQFAGTYAGNGFNMIFRPRAENSTEEQIKKTPTSKDPKDNVLELNLTTEQLSFGGHLGDIPNRGFGDEPDISLAGVPYVQTVQDRTNEETGLGNNPDKTDIHFEPGVFLFVPAAGFQGNKESIVRMATIPHGTTINAQGFFPGGEPKITTDASGTRPKFPLIDTTPFFIDTKEPQHFDSMDAEKQETLRIPQNLESFTKTGKITSKMIRYPNMFLEKAIENLDIEKTVTFDVSTEPTDSTLLGGGITNIAFLGGKPELKANNDLKTASMDHPTAQAVSMTATYWIETVWYDVTVPIVKKNGVVILRATMPKDSTAPIPAFKVTVGKNGNTAKKVIKIPGTQIQVSQKVILNFGPLSWPHVSVSTLVPKSPQPFKMHD